MRLGWRCRKRPRPRRRRSTWESRTCTAARMNFPLRAHRTAVGNKQVSGVRRAGVGCRAYACRPIARRRLWAVGRTASARRQESGFGIQHSVAARVGAGLAPWAGDDQRVSAAGEVTKCRFLPPAQIPPFEENDLSRNSLPQAGHPWRQELRGAVVRRLTDYSTSTLSGTR